MRIKKIMLQNIRSYDIAEIEFPEGNVLLSGDIGSGKSSVLLAVEFALFGLQRGVGGNILLRNGKNVGGVKLDFEVDGKNVRIERILKRSKDSIKQDASYIEIDGHKEQLSTTELKSKVLSLLNYPQEYVSKNPIVYRYTVYTPQEEMKNILTEDSSLRLDTLRKVFGIDKYKRVIENSEILSAHLRERIKEKEGRTVDLEEKKAELAVRKEEHSSINREIAALRIKFDRSNRVVEEKKGLIEVKEKELRELNRIKNELSSVSAELRTKKDQKKNNSESISELKDKIKLLEERIEQKKAEIGIPDSLESDIKKKEQELNDVDRKYLEVSRSIAAEESGKLKLQKVVKEITSLENCPTCRQKVGQEHKHSINYKTEKEVAEIDQKLSKFKTERDELENRKRDVIKEVNSLRLKDKNLALLRAEIRSVEDYKTTLKRFELLDKQIFESFALLDEKKAELEQEKTKFDDFDAVYAQLRKEFEDSREIQKQVEISKARIERRLEDLDEMMLRLEKEISDKEKIKKGIAKLKKMRDWLSGNFSLVINEIERAVMSKVHAEFSSLFGKWFAMLAEGLNARINEEFTPVIEQQGYEIEYSYLSGGERTAAALAYRLALNQVINSIMSDIKTKDLLILDEPTDGFSFEQLDRMRDVLNELKISQLILVSHEQKIESFVESIIRFQKDNVTKITRS